MIVFHTTHLWDPIYTRTSRTLSLVKQATVKIALDKQATIKKQKTGTYGSFETTRPLGARLAAEAEEGKVPLVAEERGAEVSPKLTLQRTKTVSKLYSAGLTSEFAAELLKKFGRNELPEKRKPKWLIVSALSRESGNQAARSRGGGER